MKIERIYIGGLSPSKGLTVSLVASRLMSVKDVEIVSINDAPIDSCGTLKQSKYAVVDADGDLIDMREFFFLEARCTSNTNDDGTQPSALELLAKQYNNTKWKGCSLRVESARPHFLKRLEIERSERKARELAEDASAKENNPAAQEDITTVSAKDDLGNNEKPTVRRRLRIKKRFGEEAYHVDTHPQTLCITDNSEWDQFASLHKRMKDKFTSQRMKLVERRKAERKQWMMKGGSKGGKEPRSGEGDDELRSLMFLNRGIHVRFDEVPMADLSDTSSSDVSVESKDEDNNAYVWSDDDDSVEDENKATDAQDSGTGSGGESEEVSTEEESQDGQIQADNEYVWSDDDSYNSNKPKKSSEFKLTNTLDEFSGGMDFDVDMNDNFDSYESNETTLQGFDDASIKLEDDIRSNLGILSKIFPGESISNTPLKAAAVDVASGDENSTKPKSSTFGSGLIVQRYDPTKDNASSQTNHLEGAKNLHQNDDEQADGDDSVEDGSIADDASEGSSQDQSVTKDEKVDNVETSESESNADVTEDDVNDKVEPQKTTQNDPAKEVYEQDKLENIFKQAREQQQSTGFSFGSMFESQLGDAATDNQTNGTPAGTGFGFSFPLDNAAAADPFVDDYSQPTSHKTTQDFDATKQSSKEAPKKTTRVGLRFPSNVLDEYESLFFSLNEGSSIIADVDSMRENAEVQEKWQKEREVLTADWKRKQKGAVSRKVKKVRRY